MLSIIAWHLCNLRTPVDKQRLSISHFKAAIDTHETTEELLDIVCSVRSFPDLH
jgi:hypothetical protein